MFCFSIVTHQYREKIMMRFALLCGLLLFNFPAYVEAEPYNRVGFQIEVAREVANDHLQATMSVEIQDKQPSRIAQQINTVLNDALNKASTFKSIKASSGNQNTRPVYGKSKHVDSWRGHAEIILESRDFKAVSELIVQLQQNMQLINMYFSVAPDTRALTENDLISEAIKKFEARANVIRTALGASSYKNVNLSINNSGGMPIPQPKALMRGTMAVDTAIPSPEFAAGDSRIVVQVSGIIELQ
jgi:predicted secreted protein